MSKISIHCDNQLAIERPQNSIYNGNVKDYGQPITFKWKFPFIILNHRITLQIYLLKVYQKIKLTTQQGERN